MSSVRRYPVFIASLVVVMGLCLPVLATQADMDNQLPPQTDPFACLICHQSADGSGLNLFGVDFLGNDRLWNRILAEMDSDGDGCVNGFELGDVDGDGENDGNVGDLQSNPGVIGDCGGATVDSRTWGELRALFDRD